MNDNPYKAPESDLTVESSEQRPQFYIVSIKKFTILFFLTLGLYSIYWFYQNWREFKAFSGRSIWPVPRAIFAIFFTHSLFGEVDKSLKETGKTFDWSPSSLATLYVTLAIISQVLDRMSMKEIGTPYSDLLSIVVLPLMYLPLLKAQKAINFSQSDPEGHLNDSFTAANYIWIVLGILFWLVTMLGFLIIFGIVDA